MKFLLRMIPEGPAVLFQSGLGLCVDPKASHGRTKSFQQISLILMPEVIPSLPCLGTD